jgi:subfamily B ATP-binding cassette protein MsbA
VYLIARAGQEIVRDLRAHLFNHLTTLGPPFFDDRRVGEVVSRIASDVAQVQHVLTSGVAEAVAAALTLAGAFAILLWASWQLTLAILVLVPPVVLVARLYGRTLHRRAVVAQDRMADVGSIAEEAFGSIRLVQVFAREQYERDRFMAALVRYQDAALGAAQVRALFGSVVGLLTLSALAGVVWIGGRQVVAGLMDPGQLVAYVAYAGIIGVAGSTLAGLYGHWSAALGATRRVFGWLDTQPTVRETPSAWAPQHIAGEVRLEKVSFGYRPGLPVLHDVDLTVEAGQTLALVGPTGGGKTSVTNLIARFYDPDSGRVTVDGHDIRDWTIQGLRRWMGVVPQETVLFNATVAENLRIGDLDASYDALEAAARAAHAHEFIVELPDGYDTLVGERGIRLSAGQRQRLAIARALLKDPRILLLDEATSSLDSESERLVQDALRVLLAGRTTIMIAHRLSTVRRADTIAVIHHGRVVETGTHATLLKADGLYRRLHDLQYWDESDARKGTPPASQVAEPWHA